ncbi:MAG: hypothetical protein KA444_08625 [Bacteroidia bacterium]|nr:hypothetical protein [Bacteroidia bacterium]
MKKFSILILFLGSILLAGCKKENDRPQWDVEVVGPLLFASLTLNELIADSTIQTANDGSVSLMIEQSFYDLATDSVYEIPDTSLSKIVVWPIFPSPIPPNTPFFSADNKIALGVSSVQLTQAVMQGGTIQIELKNTLPTKVIYTYTIPKAIKDGVPFSIVQEVAAENSAGPGTFNGTYDLSGYDIDLTGPLGDQFNTITYNVNAVSDPNGPAFNINTNDTVINLNFTLVDMHPAYVKGYLGQTSLSEVSIQSTGLNNFVQGGLIRLDSLSMDLDIENSIGADARIFFNSLQSLNDRTGITVPLIAPSILNRPLNINRAQESGPPLSPVIISKHNYHLDNSNSNLKAFVENLPERIYFDVDLELNPLGNFSVYNDFLYSDQLAEGKLTIKIPLRLAAENLLLVDTQSVALSSLTNLDPFGPLTLTLVATNGFPLDFDMQLFMLDENQVFLDSLLIPGLIARANIDTDYKVTTPVTTRIEIPVDSRRKEVILQSKYMSVRTKFNSPDFPQYIQLYSSYRLDLQLIANGTYYIR